MRRRLVLLLFVSTALAAKPFTLPEVLKQLRNGLEWQSLDLGFQVAQRNYESTQAAAGIRVNVGADASNNTNVATGANNFSIKITGTASLPVLPWASQFDDIRRAERTFDRAKLDLRDSRNTLIVNTSNQYYSLRIAELDLEIAKNTLLLRDNQLKIAQIQRSNNQITAEQLSSSQQNLETAKNTAEQANASLELAQLTIANTLGTTDTISPTSPTSAPTLPLEPVEALIKKSFDTRADVLKAILSLRDAEDAVVIAQRNRALPNSSVTLGISDSGANLSTGLNLQTGSLSVSGSYQPPSGTSSSSGTTISLSASISVPLIAPSSDAQVASAQTALEIAKQNLERSKKTAELDIRQKYIDTQNAIRRIPLSQKALENAKNNLTTTQTRFTAGSITKTDLETSKLAVQQAERDLENTIMAAISAALKLEIALGKEMRI